MSISTFLDLGTSSYPSSRNLTDMNCVYPGKNGVGGIYLGNIDAANNKELLKKYNIKAVLSVISTGTVLLDPGVAQMRIQAYDSDDFPLSKYFNQSTNFIEKHRAVANILVHCYAGISRSTTIVAAYLMKKHNWSAQYTLKQIQMNRRIADPNPGFVSQLKQLEIKINGGNEVQKPRALGDFNMNFRQRSLSQKKRNSNSLGFLDFDLKLNDLRKSRNDKIKLQSPNRSVRNIENKRFEQSPKLFFSGKKTQQNQENTLNKQNSATKSFLRTSFFRY